MSEIVGRAGEPPPGVAERLERLRAMFIPEDDSEVRQRLATERPRQSEPFAAAVRRRLRELGALCDLASHLHRHR